MLSSSRSRSVRLLGAGAVVSALALGAAGSLPAQADPLPDPGTVVGGLGGSQPLPGGEAVGLPAPELPGVPLPVVPLPQDPGTRGDETSAPVVPPSDDGAGLQAAAVQEPHRAVAALTFSVTVGEGLTTTPTSPGEQECTVDADLYLPPQALAEDPEPVPAILTTNGFGGDKGDQAGIGTALSTQEHGYAVLSYTGLGFPDSDCEIFLDDPAFDGAAASQLVDFLAGTTTATRDGAEYSLAEVIDTDESGPRVGMVGGSYGGQVQFAAAAVDDRIDALVPLITWNDLQYSLAPNNTSLDGVTPSTPGTEKVIWTSAFFALGIADGVQGSLTSPDSQGCANFRADACLAKVQLDAMGYPDDDTIALTNKVSVAHYIEDVKAPTLLIQGQNDTLFNLQEAVTTYRSLQEQGTEVSMVWQSWGHSGGGKPATGELDLNGADLEDTYLGRRILDWFELHVKDDTATPAGPEFSYFQPWAFAATGDARKSYATADSYPVGRDQQLFLSGGKPGAGGDLVPEAADVTAGSVQWTNPVGSAPSSFSEVSAAPEQPGPPTDAPGTFGSWTTQPLAEDLDVVGVPELEVTFTSPVVEDTQEPLGAEGQLLVFAKLYDLDPEGNITLVNRLISPTRVPDVTKPVTIELPGIVHRVPAGHRLQLVLAGSDAAYRNNELVQPVSVASTAGSDDFTLTLPTMQDLALQPARGDDGSGAGDDSAGGQARDATLVASRAPASGRSGPLPRTGVEIAGLLAAGLLLAGGGYGLLRRSRRV